MSARLEYLPTMLSRASLYISLLSLLSIDALTAFLLIPAAIQLQSP